VKAIQELNDKVESLQKGSSVSSDRLNLMYEGPVLVGGDTAGIAQIEPGDKEVTVEFKNPYNFTPVITASPINEQLNGVEYMLKNINSNGFTIELSEVSTGIKSFSWHAFAVKDLEVQSSKAHRNQPEQLQPIQESVNQLNSETVTTSTDSLQTSTDLESVK
jgi:hypothetical protein